MQTVFYALIDKRTGETVGIFIDYMDADLMAEAKRLSALHEIKEVSASEALAILSSRSLGR